MKELLETDRLILKPPSIEDAEALSIAANHEKLADWWIGVPYPYTLDFARETLEKWTDPDQTKNTRRFFVRLKETSEMIGVVDLKWISEKHRKAEIGFWITPGHWGKGLATELVTGMLHYGFEDLKLNRICGIALKHNLASMRVLTKAGLRHEGTLRDEIVFQGEPCDTESFSITRKMWDEGVKPPLKLELETERLILRTPVISDAKALMEVASDPVISDNSAHIPYPFTIDDAHRWIYEQAHNAAHRDAVSCLIFMKETGELTGAIWLRSNLRHRKAGIAYFVGSRFWNMGIATEAVARMVDYGFGELGLERIGASVIIGNDASVRVLTKAGFMHEGDAMKEWWREDRPLHCHHLSILKKD